MHTSVQTRLDFQNARLHKMNPKEGYQFSEVVQSLQMFAAGLEGLRNCRLFRFRPSLSASVDIWDIQQAHTCGLVLLPFTSQPVCTEEDC